MKIKNKEIALTSTIALFITLLVIFSSGNFLTGNIVATLFVTGEIKLIQCSVEVADGWNLVSIPCQTLGDNLSEVFSTINNSYLSVHSYEETTPADPWKAYNPYLPNWTVQDLDQIDNFDGFWIRMNQSGSINYSGTIALPTTVGLLPGWNLVGYPTNYTKTVGNAFAAISGILASAHMYNASDSSDPWKVYSPTIPGGAVDFNYTVPGFGIWLNVSSSGGWTLLGGED